MERLNPSAEELVRATRQALKPNEADRERVFQALLPHVGGLQGAEGMNGLPRASAAGRGILVKASAVLVGLGVVGGGLFLASRPAPPATKTVAVAPQKSPPEAPSPADVPPESAVPAPPQAEVAEKRPPAPARSADNLAQEVAILSRAGSELHAGRPAEALKVLEEHQRRFPGGVLTQERSATRVQALCALGRMKEAQNELARLARTAPQSPHVARAKKACGFAPAGEK
jgi:hypothetical protein